ncbi:large conductance mechanosensitive channel protein MscL [Brachyspira murdochii]|uniref:Large-conductance mechanosensitive channel n=2 Tax=Brachyspira murdochii TaxID=84378 RepID=D5U6R9_BRAM5|nr:large conductance mechanosensitive channel protein MscL [Brachyspira murdochii]ADG70635.1 large conductance mechanosensitive channel protein [Brachyspira murdochii DSM 12563]PPS20660.1 mechanosensitive ion channel protein MscL [Brachyspira murdochii]
MIEEFKKFIMRGNILDMAIGIVIGASFTKIVNSFVEDILMPPIGLILSGIDFSNIFIVIKKGISDAGPYTSIEAAKQAGAVVIGFGVFINTIISFFITALAIFMIIKIFNKMREKMVKKEKEDKEAEEKICPYCCSSVNIKAVKCPHCTSDLDK